jgi:glutamyl-tRNA synthetase
MSPPRVRFAPSPTGFLHVGGLRTALYNYLYARKHGGTFILRIEDTDRERFVPGAVENLIETLRWAGLEYDEGPVKGGPCGPYIQSERLEIYRAHADRLLASGHAYYAFDTAEELKAMRVGLEKAGKNPKYDRRALALTPADVEAKLAAGLPRVVRLKVPDGGSIVVEDCIRGRVEIEADQVDDQILLKSDGYPTYHLANVVDDHLMGVTHVIRGEEWLPSTPKHVLLYRAFGWDLPEFAHLPLLLNPDRSKLSKRQGDVAVEDYRAKGYLREALVNFVAFLGWNPGDEREIFSLGELVQEFSLERVGKSGAIFNIEKLDWMNFEHLRRLPPDLLVGMVRAELAASGREPGRFTDDYLGRVIAAMRERATSPALFVTACPYFYDPPAAYDPEVLKKRWKPETPARLRSLAEAFSRLDQAGPADFEDALKRTAGELGIGAGELVHPVRLAVSGTGIGPGLYDILSILGRDETLRRISTALGTIT